MVIASWVVSTPIELLVKLVNCETNATLSSCGRNFNVRDTDVNYDLPRSFCDGMISLLWDGISGDEGSSMAKVTCLDFGPKGDDPLQVFKKLLFGFVLQVERSGVSYIAKVLVQGLRDSVKVLVVESLTQILYEFGLRGNGVGHWDEATEGGLPEDPEASRTLRVLYCTPTPTFPATIIRRLSDCP